eukprot:366399-Chlamydomonas_euryale.AAC.25
MLEVLPLGASKGAGVAWLLEHLGLDASGLMALGDGENDLEMLQMAAVRHAVAQVGALAGLHVVDRGRALCGRTAGPGCS